MKKHKSATLLVALLVAIGLFGPVGCATTGDPVTDEQRVKRAAAYLELGTETAVTQLLIKYPRLVVYSEAAVEALDLLLAEEDYDPDSLIARLRALKVDQLNDPRVLEAVRSVIKLYQVEADSLLERKMDANIYIRPLLQAFRDGVRSAIDRKD